MNPIQTTCPVCEYDRAFISSGKLRCHCGYEADASPLQSKPMTEPQPARVILTPEQYANLSSFEVSCRNMEEILDDACGFGELPIDALKRVVAEHDKLTGLLEPLCTQGETSLQALERLIEERDKAVEQRNGLKAQVHRLVDEFAGKEFDFKVSESLKDEKINQLKAELDRLNARFAEAQGEPKQPELPREVGYAHSMLCQALQSIVGGNSRTGAQRVNSARQALEELIFNWGTNGGER